MEVLGFLLIGAIAGWAAGEFMRGAGFGVIGNIIIGVIGAFVGGMFLPLIGLMASGAIGTFVTAFLGAVLFIYLIKLIKRA